MPPLLRRGRAIVGAIAVTHVALAIGVIVLVLLLGKFEHLPRLGAKLLATASTAYGLWQGSRWAKWLYVVGFAVGAGFLLYLAASMPPAVMWLPGSGGVLFGVLAGLLAFSPAVNQFMAFQRGERVREEPDEFEDEEETAAPVLAGRLCAACGYAGTSVNMLFCSECGQRIG
jgi:hypothetical protein